MSNDNQENGSNEHFLGIDYGKKNVGIALADAEMRIAFGYGAFLNDKNLIQKIAELIAEKNVKNVIIGIPTYINKSAVVYESEKFGETLEKNLGVKVSYQNEMFTTKIAQANLIEKGVKGIKKHDDQEAARIILQEWLDGNTEQ